MDVSSATQLMMTPIPYTYRHIQPIKSDFPITSKTVAQVFICGLHAVEK